MIGPALKISVVTDNLNQLINVFYFPEGRWCSVFERKKVNNCIQSNGQVILLRSLAFDSYVHLREGYIIPLQNVWNLKK